MTLLKNLYEEIIVSGQRSETALHKQMGSHPQQKEGRRCSTESCQQLVLGRLQITVQKNQPTNSLSLPLFPCSPKLAVDSFRESAPDRRPSGHAPCTCEPGLSPLCRTGLPSCEQSYTQARPPKNPVGNRAPSVELKELFLFRARMAV